MEPQLVPVQSGVPGQGNKLVSFLRSGYIVTSGQSNNEIFAISRNHNSEYAKFLTNMEDNSKIGNSWDFKATAIGLRAIKYGDTAPTLAEIHDMKKYLASLEVSIKVGGDSRPMCEISGAQLMSVEEFASSTGTIAAQGTRMNAEIGLPTPINIQRGWEIKGEVKSNIAPPASLVVADQEWAILVVLVGFKQTY